MATRSLSQETREYRIFRVNYDRLLHAIQDPLPLAARLFSEGIISSSVKEHMSVSGVPRLDKNNTLLSAVEGHIQTDPTTFDVFMSALKEDPTLLSLVESMEGDRDPGVLDESRPPQSREERSIDWTTKYECIVSGLENMSAHGESAPYPRHFPRHHSQCQHHKQCTHQSLQNLYRPPTHPHNYPPCQIWKHEHNPYQPPVWHQPTCRAPVQPPHQSLCCLPPHSSLHVGQPSFEQSRPTYHQPPTPYPSHLPFIPLTSQHVSTRLPLTNLPIHVYPPPHQSSHCPAHPPTLHFPMGQHSYQLSRDFHSNSYQPSHHSSNPPPIQSPHPFISSIYQPPPTPHPDTPLGKYALFLRACYTHHGCSSTKWPPLDAVNYVNLAVISSEYANKKELLKFREQTIHGSIDDILEWKAPIAMQDILKLNCRGQEAYPVTQLLIEGAPGIGKSTFAWEVCQKWGQHQLFNEYSLVVLLRFRDKRVQEAESISDLFYYPLPELQSEIVRDIVSSGGQDLLLILEGFDEAPASKRTMDTIFVRLFRGQELPKATVILTTRPSASVELRKICRSKHSRRIEVVGFSKKEIAEYIQHAFTDRQSLSTFSEYLSLYPHIHSCMYVPLNCAIVTHVYQSCTSTSTVVPKTMTQLYSSLIRSLLLRYLSDREEYRDTCSSIHSFRDLPQPVCNQFHGVCKLAYMKIMRSETELIFQDLPDDFDPLGLMQTCPELYVDSGASLSYNFLHLTIQEYLAAYYISQQSRDEQVAFIEEHIENKKLEVVVRFLAGFSLSELGQDLLDVVREFSNRDLPVWSLLKGFGETKCVRLQILHWLFESQHLSAITRILGSGSVSFRHDFTASLPFDSYVLGYCITHSTCDWKLELRYCELESVETFLNSLNLQQDQFLIGQIKQMVFWKSDPDALHLFAANVPQILVFRSLTHLSLVYSQLTSKICEVFCGLKDLLQHLLQLNLGCNPIGRRGAVNLITSLTKFGTVRELELSDTSIGFEDCMALSELLASSKCIEILDIGTNSLSPDSIQLVIDGVSCNTSLEKLLVGNSSFSSENVLSLASVLRVNIRLKELHIEHCNIQSSDSVYLAKALEENTTTQLQTLWLSGNLIGLEGAAAFAHMLATNESLATLVMDGCNIEEEGALAFSSILKMNQCLKTLWLIDISIGVEGVLNLIESLQQNTALGKLMLSRDCKPPSSSTLDKTLQERVEFG